MENIINGHILKNRQSIKRSNWKTRRYGCFYFLFKFTRRSNENKEEKAKVLESGGLFVIGTERHESRRIDNQLRGRTGRQGDKGASIFYLSLQDDLMRILDLKKLILCCKS